jgi:hypothetical protein
VYTRGDNCNVDNETGDSDDEEMPEAVRNLHEGLDAKSDTSHVPRSAEMRHAGCGHPSSCSPAAASKISCVEIACGCRYKASTLFWYSNINYYYLIMFRRELRLPSVM